MERACLARVGERGKESAQQARAAVTTLTHKSATGNPLSPQPRDRPVLLTAIQGRLELLDSSWGLGWYGLKPSRPSGL